MEKIEHNLQTGVTSIVQLTDLEVAVIETNKNSNEFIKAQAKQVERTSKLVGIQILGVMCSATKADQMGLTAVGLDYSMTTAAGGTFASTEFSFENGNVLTITADNFATVYNTWVPFRRSFFAVGE